MSHSENKVRWCLEKAKKENESSGKHRGLVKIRPAENISREHIRKAEHYLEATILLEDKFSDICASTIFYSTYHSMLSILAKFGFESRNQECTFALIYSLIEEGKISLKKEDIDKIALLNEENSVIELREKYQYGVELSMKKEVYNENFSFAKIILGKVKEIIE